VAPRCDEAVHQKLDVRTGFWAGAREVRAWAGSQSRILWGWSRWLHCDAEILETNRWFALD
jgi:hypothetical protein